MGSSLGILADVLEAGRTVWTFTPSNAAANAMLIVHGGVIATLMDTAMGSAVYTDAARRRPLPPRLNSR